LEVRAAAGVILGNVGGGDDQVAGCIGIEDAFETGDDPTEDRIVIGRVDSEPRLNVGEGAYAPARSAEDRALVTIGLAAVLPFDPIGIGQARRRL